MKKISVEIQVRFSDLDAYGHVNNAVYLSYLEIARIELVRDMFVKDMKKNIQYLLVGVELKYLQPVLFEDKLIVDCWVEPFGKVRFKAVYKLHDGRGKTYASGHTEHALFDGNARRPTRLTEEWLKILGEHADG